MPAVEHILLESDELNLPQRQTARKVHASHRFHCRLRRRVVELEIIDYYYLFCRQRNARTELSECVFDLRFVDPIVRQSRHVPARWLALSTCLALFAILMWTDALSRYDLSHSRLSIGALLLFLAACSAVVSLYRLKETLEIRSLHGQAKLLELTGSLGTLRSLRPFMRKLGAHVRIAAGIRRDSKAAHLRDEMREHHRLREAGILSDWQYEESKRLILAHHSVA